MSDHLRHLIPGYRLGLLEEGKAQELRAHLRTCADCRAVFEEFVEPTDDETTRPDHLPLALITRWDALPLAEPEKEMIEEHFAHCDACREAREFARTIRAARRPARPRVPWKWVGLGTAAIAAVFAAISSTSIRQSSRHAPPALQAEGTPALRHDPGPVPLRADTVQLGSLRGAPQPVVVVPAGTTILPIRVPPLLGVRGRARIVIRVYGPGWTEYAHAEVEHRTLFGTGEKPTLEVRGPDGVLPEGSYHVEVASDVPDPSSPGRSEGAVYDFELRDSR